MAITALVWSAFTRGQSGRRDAADLQARLQEWNERRMLWAIERVSRHVLRGDAEALQGAEQRGHGMAAVLEHPAVTPGGNEQF